MSPEAFSTFWRLTKPGGVPEKVKVTAWGQLGVLVTAKFVSDGWVSIPTLIVIKLGGGVVRARVVTWQVTMILKET
jgi:hypothetical protein